MLANRSLKRLLTRKEKNLDPTIKRKIPLETRLKVYRLTRGKNVNEMFSVLEEYADTITELVRLVEWSVIVKGNDYY